MIFVAFAYFAIGSASHTLQWQCSLFQPDEPAKETTAASAAETVPVVVDTKADDQPASETIAESAPSKEVAVLAKEEETANEEPVREEPAQEEQPKKDTSIDAIDAVIAAPVAEEKKV